MSTQFGIINRTYSDAIREMATSKSATTLFNHGSEHAIIVLESILYQAKQVKMFAGNFKEEVCNDSTKRFEKALRHFLLNEGKISIILNEFTEEEFFENEEYDAKKNTTISILRQYATSPSYEGNIKLYITNDKPIIDGNEVHFTIGDEIMYRLEYDTKNLRAKFCFNDEETCKILIDKFNLLQAQSHQLSLAEILMLA